VPVEKATYAMHKASTARNKYLRFPELILGPKGTTKKVSLCDVNNRKPSALMMLVIANWFASSEELAFDIANKVASAEAARKWACNFQSVNDDDSVVQMHQGLCRDKIACIAKAKLEKKELKLQILRLTQTIIASYYPRKM